MSTPITYDQLQTRMDEIHAEIKIIHTAAYKMMQSGSLDPEDSFIFTELANILNSTDKISNDIEEQYMDKKIEPNNIFPRD